MNIFVLLRSFFMCECRSLPKLNFQNMSSNGNFYNINVTSYVYEEIFGRMDCLILIDRWMLAI